MELDLIQEEVFHNQVEDMADFSMNNQDRKTRTRIINVHNNNPVFYPFSIKVN